MPNIQIPEIAALRLVIDNVAAALCPDSPIESARAEFALDGMGAVQIISRLHRELAEARKALKDARAEAEHNLRCNHPADDGSDDCNNSDDCLYHGILEIIDAA